MLAHNDVVATIPVHDMGRARQFYEGILGLVVVEIMDDLMTIYRAGDTRIFIYKTVNPINSLTVVATWAVDDSIELLVDELQKKGITFEHFKKDGFEPRGNLYYADGIKVALFKDPDGNMLSLFQATI